MKSNPCNPDRLSRRTILSTAAKISRFSIRRTTVACPADLAFLKHLKMESCQYSIVDATILHAPTSTKNREQQDGRVHDTRSEEHTSELQSLAYLVCRLLLEKKKINHRNRTQCR